MAPIQGLKYHELCDQGTGNRLALDRIGQGSDTMRQLAVAISGVLRSIRGPGGPLHGDRGKAFVSFTRGLEACRTGLNTELEHCGILVKPEQNKLPATLEEVKTLIQGKDDFSIAIHGIDYESAPEDLNAQVLEYEAARFMKDRCCQHGRPQKMLVWTPRRTEADSRRYNQFVVSLEAPVCPPGLSLCDLPFPDFHTRVFTELSSVDRKPRWTPPEGDELPPHTYGIYVLRQRSDTRDPRYCAMRELLEGLPSVKVWESDDSGKTDPAATRSREEWILNEATTALVFGSVDSLPFVRQNFRGKLKNWDRASSSLGFYLTMPDSDFAPNKGVVYNSGGPFDKDAFLSKLKSILPGVK